MLITDENLGNLSRKTKNIENPVKILELKKCF